MSYYEARWSGEFPTLCKGMWSLYRDGEELDCDIPFNDYEKGRGVPANTFGGNTGWQWEEESMGEEYYVYTDGLPMKDWIAEYRWWLETIAEPEDWPAVFEAFQEEDWRPRTCGGCI